MSKATSKKPLTPLQAIRRFCVDQCQAEVPSGVKDCQGDEWVIGPCPFYPLRYGRGKKGMSALKVIRQHCRMCFQDDMQGIRECLDTRCPVHPFRLGKNPNYSDEYREKARQRRASKIESLV